MRVLLWNCPWESQGQLFFYEGCLRDTLIPEANLLAQKQENVYIVYADYLQEQYQAQINEKVIQHIINTNDLFQITGNTNVLEMLYDNNEELILSILEYFQGKLPERIDVILTWENPIPFLEVMYPDALIINQMPGSFSRAPYPNTITFDPVGLYKDSLLVSEAKKIFAIGYGESEIDFTKSFIEKTLLEIAEIQPYEKSDIVSDERKLILLPLQVSEHYAFSVDNDCSSQLKILQKTFRETDVETESVLVTQYKSSFTADQPINAKNYDKYKMLWENLVWQENFDLLPFPSQVLLPIVDEVRAFTSSLVFQAMAFGKKITILEGSYYKVFEATKYDEIERNKHVITFLLNRYQPLASSIRQDANFLNALLSRMLLNKKKGLKGKDICVDFQSIDPQYQKKYFLEFSNKNLLKPIAKISPRVKLQYDFLNKFNQIVKKNNVEVISFDIFDTLLQRPIENPSSLFKIIAQEVFRQLNLRLNEFYQIRIWAESKARKDTMLEEVTLDEIYINIQNFYSLTEEEIFVIKEIEKEVEYVHIQPRKLGARLWNSALLARKPIILISDMYIDGDSIKRMLKKCNFIGYDRLYLSSHLMKTKHSGNLFAHVLDDLNISGSNLLHIGDNLNTDINSAKKFNIQSFYIPKATVRLHINKRWDELFSGKIKGDLVREMILGLIANKNFSDIPVEKESNSLFAGDVTRLGYAALGSLYTGFAQWLAKEAKRNKIECLYFLSREGYILKEVFDVINKNRNIKTEYLYCSRRAVGVAALTTKQDVMTLASLPFANDISLTGLLESRFGIAFDKIPQNLLDPQLLSKVDILSLKSNLDNRVWLGHFCGSIYRYILDAVSAERVAYKQYLTDTGFLSTDNIAIVDIGWKGNMQAHLASMSRKKIKGFYFSSLVGAEFNELISGEMFTYMGANIGREHFDIIVKNRKLFELLTCHSDKSLKCLKQVENKILPVFLEETNHEKRALLIDKLHNGAKEFAIDYANSFSRRSITINPELATYILRNFFAKPDRVDINILDGLYFEDAFSGASEIEFSNYLNTIWPEAYQVLNLNKQSVVKKKTKVQECIEPNQVVESENKSLNFLLGVEATVMNLVLTKNKSNKYKRSRDDFWLDSRGKLSGIWGKLTVNR